MARLLSVTISATSLANAPTRAAERAQICTLLQMIAQEIGQGVSLENSSVKDASGVVGSFVYTPQANS